MHVRHRSFRRSLCYLFAYLLSMALVLPGAARAGSLRQDSNGLWYEYLPQTRLPVTQSLRYPNGGGQDSTDRKAQRGPLDKGWETEKIRMAGYWASKATEDTCSNGRMVVGTIADTPTSKIEMAGMVDIRTKWNHFGGCEPENQRVSGVDLVGRTVTWAYACPHGSSLTNEMDDAQEAKLCRRPLDYQPGCCGNPVTHTSSKIQHETDYVAADGLLRMERTYSSSETLLASNAPPPGWVNSWQGSIKPNGIGFTVLRPSGQRLHYRLVDGQLTPLQPTTVTLRLVPTGFELLDEDDRRELYDRSGALTEVRERDGRGVTISLTTSGDDSVSVVTDTYGRQLKLIFRSAEWDPEARSLQEVVLPDGGHIRYTHVSLTGWLSSVTYPDGSVRRYGAGPNDANALKLFNITDENGTQYASFGYGSWDRAVATVTQHAGEVERYEVRDFRVDSGVDSVFVLEPLGLMEENRYAKVNSISRLVSTIRGPAGTSSLTYDAAGNLASRKDYNGNLTTYAYDPLRNLELSRTEGLAANGALTAISRTIETTWHAQYKLPISVVEKDAAGAVQRTTENSWDERGNLVRQTVRDPLSGAEKTTLWNFSYSASVPGHLERLVIDGPRTDLPDLTTIDYWPADATCEGSGEGQDKGCRGRVKTVTDALGHVTQFQRYDANGQPLRILDQNGVATSYTYNARGWLTARSTAGETTTWDYDAAGQLTRVGRPDGSKSGYAYDAAHRLVSVADSESNSISYQLDAMGNRIVETTRDSVGVQLRQVRRSYDQLNRLTSTTGLAP